MLKIHTVNSGRPVSHTSLTSTALKLLHLTLTRRYSVHASWFCAVCSDLQATHKKNIWSVFTVSEMWPRPAQKYHFLAQRVKQEAEGEGEIHDFPKMALWAIMRLQIFDEGFRTAGSTIQQKHTLSQWSHLCLRVQKTKLLQIDSNASDTWQRVSLFYLKSVKFAHSSMIGWTIYHFDHDVMSLSRNFSTWAPEIISYGIPFLPVKKNQKKQ